MERACLVSHGTRAWIEKKNEGTRVAFSFQPMQSSYNQYKYGECLKAFLLPPLTYWTIGSNDRREEGHIMFRTALESQHPL